MGQTNILTKEAFEQDQTLKSKFGSYENYTTSFQQGGTTKNNAGTTPQNSEQPTSTPTENNPDYTMNDVASVAETGSLPPAEPKSAYETYMEKAKNIYNQGVEANNKNAANQAASAWAEYKELNRNIGEINKANGRANTGYAGDTSIDAYNAYRNSVNKSYYDANSANNDLYSYYLSEMTKIQQAKDNKEATDRQVEQTDRQLDMQEQQYQDEKETNVVSEVSGMLAEDGAFNNDGTITSETAKKTWDYITRIYGDDIPETTMAYLESQDGFSEWLDAYNSGTELDDYIKKHEYLNKAFECTIDGNKYILSTGALANKNYSNILDNMVSGERSPMKTTYYNGKFYIVDGEHNWREVVSGESNINDALNAYKKVAQVK